MQGVWRERRRPLPRRARRAAVVAVLLTASCTGSESPEEPTDRPRERRAIESGELRLAGPGRIDAPYAAGNRVFGLQTGDEPEELAAAMNTVLIGTLSPAMVPAVDGSRIAYNAWRGEVPVLRTHDARTDRDRVVVEGAYSIAWREDGAFAYVKGIAPKVDLQNVGDYVGHVLVRRAPGARSVRWSTTPARYVVAAWGAERLLAYRLGDEWPDLVLFDGKGQEHVVARSSALIALSPDGERAFVARYDATPPLVRIVDLSDRKEVARLEVTPDAAGTRIDWIVEAGSWSGDLVVAKASAGLVAFRVSDEIAVEQVMRLDGAAFPLGVFEPHIVDGGSSVVAWGQLEGRPRQPVPGAAVIQCSRVELRCVRGPDLSAAEGPRIVYNPSRPAP